MTSARPQPPAPTRHADLRGRPLPEVRAAIRAGAYTRHTAGLADGHLQVNLAIFTADLALDFFRYCQRNPRPCPLVGVTDTGDPILRTLGSDLDVRTDAPGYAIYRDGVRTGTAPDIADLWRADHVAFAIGCSFTFERALIEAGIPVRHIERDATVPMFRTSLQTVPAGPFRGGMVMSMRPIPEADVARTVEICRHYPLAHGAPVHVGDPAAIGIADLDAPDWGDAMPVAPGEVPVFWACGVTPQNAAREARPALFISHDPGAMLITDVGERADPPILTP